MKDKSIHHGVVDDVCQNNGPVFSQQLPSLWTHRPSASEFLTGQQAFQQISDKIQVAKFIL